MGTLLSGTAHLLAFFSPFLPSMLDLHTESRSLSYHETSFLNFLRQLWKSDWAASRDATPFDATFEAADERDDNLEGIVNPNTYYRSYVASMVSDPSVQDMETILNRISSQTTKRTENNHHAPSIEHLVTLPVYLCARIMGTFDFSVLRPIPSFLLEARPHDTPDSSSTDTELGVPSISQLGEEYWENDGVVPVFSQWHPLACRSDFS